VLRSIARAIGIAVLVGAWWSQVRAAGPTLDASWRVITGGGDGTASELALTVTIEKGWHLNANDPDRAYLIPTTLDVDPPSGITMQSIRYPEPVTRALGFAPGTALRLYEGAFTIAVRVAGAPPSHFDATLRYQACNEETCLPPKTLAVPFDAKRLVGGGK
jgi:thiol:disulfide interchange protein DsbD